MASSAAVCGSCSIGRSASRSKDAVRYCRSPLGSHRSKQQRHNGGQAACIMVISLGRVTAPGIALHPRSMEAVDGRSDHRPSLLGNQRCQFVGHGGLAGCRSPIDRDPAGLPRRKRPSFVATSFSTPILFTIRVRTCMFPWATECRRRGSFASPTSLADGGTRLPEIVFCVSWMSICSSPTSISQSNRKPGLNRPIEACEHAHRFPGTRGFLERG
jgi:hypothetical protein